MVYRETTITDIHSWDTHTMLLLLFHSAVDGLAIKKTNMTMYIRLPSNLKTVN